MLSRDRSAIGPCALAIMLIAALPSSAQAEESPLLPTAGHDKKLFIQSADGRFRTNLGFRVQARLTWDAPETASGDRAQLQRFAIQRLRLTLSGHAYSRALTYKFQMGLDKGNVVLKDGWTEYAAIGKALRIRVGQYKVPFSRHQITSSTKLLLVDRAITDHFFDTGRDLGVMLHNRYEKSPTFEWAFGVFDGTGAKPRFSGTVEGVDPTTGEGVVSHGKFSNVPEQLKPLIVGRVGYNRGKLKGYSESDLQGGPVRFGVGLSGRAELDEEGGDDGNLQGEIDMILKRQGFTATVEVVMAAAQDGPNWGDQSYEAFGLHAQLGQVIDDWIEPTARYALVAPDGDNNNADEIDLGCNLFFEGHAVKLASDIALLRRELSERTDVRARTQLQFYF